MILKILAVLAALAAALPQHHHARRPTHRTTAPPVVRVLGWTPCKPGPSCYVPQLSATFPDYGNVQHSPVAAADDCTFASAADWEQIVLGASPSPPAVEQEFASVPNSAGGLTLQQFSSWWENQGIAGVRVTALSAEPNDQAAVERMLPVERAVLVLLHFDGSTQFGPWTPGPGYHMAVVDGYDPTGPVVVTWGVQAQVSWAEWAALAQGVYVVQQ